MTEIMIFVVGMHVHMQKQFSGIKKKSVGIKP